MNQYPTYRESGVEWEPLIPVTWRLMRTRFLCRITTGEGDTVDSDPDGEYPFYVRSVEVQRSDTFGFEGDAVLTSGDGAGVGKIFHLANGRFRAHQRVYVLNDFHEINPGFFYYYFSTYLQKVVLDGSAKSTVDSIRRPMIADFPVFVPALNDQVRITKYLDRETAQIDAFIADQEELIALLTERRAATISHAVTKGLDPTAPMKDSGVEWLGQVPHHWTVGPAKHFGSVVLGKMLQESETTEATQSRPYLRAASVQPDGRLDLASAKEMWFSQREASRLNLKRNDVVIVEGGVGGFGRAALIRDPLSGWAFQNSIIRIRPREKAIDGGFVTYQFLHLREVGYIEMAASVTSMPHYTVDKVTTTTVAWPDFEEQKRISAFLDREMSELDAAIADAREAIALSKERRAALISAAVTGKIDVRGEVA